MAEEQPKQQEDKECIRNEENDQELSECNSMDVRHEYEEEVEEAQPNMVQEDLKQQ